MAREAACPVEPAESSFYQLDEDNENMEIMTDYLKKEVITLKELLPEWWGKERYAHNTQEL